MLPLLLRPARLAVTVALAAAALPTVTPADSFEPPAGEALRATVFGAPPDSMAERPRRVPLREMKLTIDGSVPVPPLFWFNRQLRVFLSAQSEPAPLVVVIAGTGGSGNTQSVQRLRDALFGAGYHVLTLPSPTFPGFLVAASSTGVAGDLQQDATDLRRAVRHALDQLPRRVEITGLHAVGYSLGGAHAAALKALDDDAEPLAIDRVVMINPPVNLLSSIERLDRLFTESIGTSDEAIERLFQQLLEDLAVLYRESGAPTMNESFLLGAAARLMRSDREFAAAIAMSFRLALINMYLIGDYYAGSGVVVDADNPPGRSDALDDELRVLRAKPFRSYFERVYLPYYRAARPEATRERLIKDASLERFAEALRDDRAYFAQHNRDDFILSADELEWLQDVLGARLAVYERGGHLGNLGTQQQIADMLRMLAGRWPPAEGDAE